ncbi:hypothetical protein EGH25_10455 [Haladaptatus sp. F3-133]|uniref:Uncharacterized protein n=1 Tax=Halorutilus salinus TaxID=2487751 RepID=A0A9Q4GH31_9EURY|nr:hypothetical protein [Halorutilus salinus]MCX2819769.1 hypothetical protein [Halorutilus salinus]
MARGEGVTVTGSIGILVVEVESDRVSEQEADRWLAVDRRNRIQSTFEGPPRLSIGILKKGVKLGYFEAYESSANTSGRKRG